MTNIRVMQNKRTLNRDLNSQLSCIGVESTIETKDSPRKQLQANYKKLESYQPHNPMTNFANVREKVGVEQLPGMSQDGSTIFDESKDLSSKI